MIYTIKCRCDLEIRPDQIIGDGYCVFCKKLFGDNEKTIKDLERDSNGNEERVDDKVIQPIKKRSKK